MKPYVCLCCFPSVCLLLFVNLDSDIVDAFQNFTSHVMAYGDMDGVALIVVYIRDVKGILVIANATSKYVAVVID